MAAASAAVQCPSPMKALPLLLFLPGLMVADPMQCTLHDVHPSARLSARMEGDSLAVAWTGENGSRLRAKFGVERSTPVIRELAAAHVSGGEAILGRNLIPEFTTVSGVRRAAHGLPDEHRWDVFWDAPLSIPGGGENPGLPRKPEEIRHGESTFNSHACEVRQDGSRLEISFPGLSLGIFSGRLQFTVYEGSNLLRVEAIAKTEEPSVAYKYTAGLRGFSRGQLERVAWRDAGGNSQKYEFGGSPNHDPVPLIARNRVAIAEGAGGSIAVFPPPHQFFFAREIEVNNGFVWYRKDDDTSFRSACARATTRAATNPSGLSVFTLCITLRQAHGSAWRLISISTPPMPPPRARLSRLIRTEIASSRSPDTRSWRRISTAFTKELTDAGSLDRQPPWIPAIRDLGVNIVMLDDFHGDGHPEDNGRLRLEDLRNYYEACRRHSDRAFLLLPGEEANVYFGGHYNLLLPKPVYWTHGRAPGSQFMEQSPPYGTVYHPANAAELFDMVRREGALVWQTHPRTKGSTFYPGRIREQDYFRSDRWLGAGFKAMPVDLSNRLFARLRCFGTLDDMNNWSAPKVLVGEVDTYKKFPDYDLYGEFNVNYVKLDALPPADDWTAVNRALRAGDFFVSTGEVLIRNFHADPREVVADVDWTFPLEFVEVVWGDGQRVGRKVVRTPDARAFGSRRFQIPLDLSKQKWVRFAAWDSAVNGAFTQPVLLKN